MIDLHALQSLVMAAAVVAAVSAYVVLDGFDLGIGVLSVFARDSAERDEMMNAIGPFWDGNETWLVFGGATLLAMFPIAFSVILPALYLPLIVMLLALVFRGVAFEFRFRHEPRLRRWDLAFAIGSLIATFAQGLVLAAFLQGIRVERNRYAGGEWDWLTQFSLLISFALVAGYGLLGSTFLFWRADGALQARAGRWARRLLYAVIAAIVVVSIWTPLRLPTAAARWLDFPFDLIFVPVPLVTALCAMQLMRKLEPGRKSAWPFVCAVGIFFLSLSGIAISLYPYLPPPSLSLFDAAASSKSQRFLLPGIVLFVPLILIRTWSNYAVFASAERDDASMSHPNLRRWN